MLKRRFKLIKQGLDDGTVLDDLADVATSAATSGQTIIWNGTDWVPGDHADIAGLSADDHPQYTAWAGDEQITGFWQFTSGYFEVRSDGYAGIWFMNQTGAADAKWVGLEYTGAANAEYGFRICDDAGFPTYRNVLVWTRSGNTLSNLSFGNATNNPTYTFLGTGAISGVGSGLTALNATQVTSGTLPDSVLSTNIPRLNGTNSTSGNWTFTYNNGEITMDGSGPRIYLNENDQAADEKLWTMRAAGKVLSIDSFNDAKSTARAAFVVNRGTGNAISSLQFGNTSDYPSASFYGAINERGTTPQYRWQESDQAVDEQWWRFLIDTKVMYLQASNDAFSTNRNILKVTRGTGAATTAHEYGNATDNPTYTFLGTGLTTLGGSLTLGTDGIVTFDEHASAPATPAAGTVALYAKADGKVYIKDDAGTETDLAAAGSGAVATDAIWDAKGDLAVGTGANTASKLAVGIDGYVLTADAAEATGLKWAAAGAGAVATDTIWDAKGDLAVGTGANTAAKLTAGTNGYVLKADSAESTGLKWVANNIDGLSDVDTTTTAPAKGDILVFDGTNWVPYYGGLSMDARAGAPNAADDEFNYGTDWDTTGARRSGATAWTKYENSTAPTVGVTGSSIVVQMPNVSGPYQYLQSCTGNWTYDAKMAMSTRSTSTAWSDFQYIGLIAKDSVSGRSHSVVLIHSTSVKWEQWRNTNYTYSSSSSPLTPDQTIDSFWGKPFYMRIVSDGTNLTWYVSYTGLEGTFHQIYTATIAAWINATINQVGIVMRGSANNPVMVIDWFRKVA